MVESLSVQTIQSVLMKRVSVMLGSRWVPLQMSVSHVAMDSTRTQQVCQHVNALPGTRVQMAESALHVSTAHRKSCLGSRRLGKQVSVLSADSVRALWLEVDSGLGLGHWSMTNSVA